jgi:hypothetical protein
MTLTKVGITSSKNNRALHGIDCETKVKGILLLLNYPLQFVVGSVLNFYKKYKYFKHNK